MPDDDRREDPARASTGVSVSGPFPAQTAADTSEPSALIRLARRMSHVYKTRVRTTTVILIGAFLGLAAFYGFSSQHYDPDVPPPARPEQVYEQPQEQAPSTEETVPEVSESPQPTEQPESTSEPSAPTQSTPPMGPRLPWERPAPPEESSESPTPNDDSNGR